MPSSRPTRCGWRKASVAAWYAPKRRPRGDQERVRVLAPGERDDLLDEILFVLDVAAGAVDGCRCQPYQLSRVHLIDAEQLQMTVLQVPARGKRRGRGLPSRRRGAWTAGRRGRAPRRGRRRAAPCRGEGGAEPAVVGAAHGGFNDRVLAAWIAGSSQPGHPPPRIATGASIGATPAGLKRCTSAFALSRRTQHRRMQSRACGGPAVGDPAIRDVVDRVSGCGTPRGGEEVGE